MRNRWDVFVEAWYEPCHYTILILMPAHHPYLTLQLVRGRASWIVSGVLQFRDSCPNDSLDGSMTRWNLRHAYAGLVTLSWQQKWFKLRIPCVVSARPGARFVTPSARKSRYASSRTSTHTHDSRNGLRVRVRLLPMFWRSAILKWFITITSLALAN